MLRLISREENVKEEAFISRGNLTADIAAAFSEDNNDGILVST